MIIEFVDLHAQITASNIRKKRKGCFAVKKFSAKLVNLKPNSYDQYCINL